MPFLKSGKKDFLKISDFNHEELDHILRTAMNLKKKNQAKEAYFPLKGKTLGLIFEHSSTRTRVAFEVGINQLGGQAIFLSTKDTQLQRGETMADTARVLSRYINAIAARVDSQENLEELARYATIPVISALTKERHPCQIMADLLTVQENFGDYEKRKVTYIGDSNNVSNSWIEAARVIGFPLTLCCPEGYHPDFELILGKGPLPKNVQWVTDPLQGVKDAEVITTDVWVSMGTEGSEGKKKTLAPYQVNDKLLKHADSRCIVLHCLPAHRGEEITHEVFEGKHSRIFDQAENKLHAQKAVLELCMTSI